jgi:nicotinamidase-related amidase
MVKENLNRDQTILLVIDTQEKLFSVVDRAQEVLANIMKVVKGFQILNLPIVISEQYPQGLGDTIAPLKNLLSRNDQVWTKSAFSCMADPAFYEYADQSSRLQWVLVGVEAHICVLQTAKGLIKSGKQVTVLNDAITSRSIYDFSTAIAEMRDEGIRISSTETILFELLQDYKAPEFKQISQLVKTQCCGVCSC